MLRLNSERLEDVMRRRFGGVREFVGEWEVRYDAGEFPGEGAPPNKATVYKWLAERTFPRREERLWRLCGLLDIDPFVLLEMPKGAEKKAFQRLYVGFATGKWPQGLGFFGEFYGLHKIWPPPRVRHYFGHGWHTQEFLHAGKRVNYWAQIELHSPPGGGAPQVFHFAYLSLERWSPYGVVERDGLALNLTQINGQIQRARLKEIGSPTLVETWFGQGSCPFRVASLHPFKLRLRARETMEDGAVRFLPN